ncbi:flagellar M-ring protein FliF [Spirochaetia bacterium]|nr:flagellar M-ring protein FliF [Spirochaetia bacterium]
MIEFFKKLGNQIKTLWGKWSLVQKLILIGIIVVAVAGIIVLFSVSASPTLAPVIDVPIQDEDARSRAITRINKEGVRTSLSPAGVIMVENAATARRMRSILMSEDLIPTGTDPWAIFDRDRWTITDFERNVNLRRAITQMVTDHIKALEDVDDANVTIVSPERALFGADQNPTTASVIIVPKPGSDIAENRKKVEGIQKILKYAVEGLTDDNIVIANQNGLVLNDFAGLADADRLSLIERGSKMIRSMETQYRALILSSLQQTFNKDRVRDLSIKIDMDLSKKAVNTDEFFPFTIIADNPNTPYDDSQIVSSVTRSQTTSRTAWKGTGYTPEGPAGVEGQTAPAYRDMANMYGEVTQDTEVKNEELNRRSTVEERNPSIDRVTISANIDGTWKVRYGEDKKPIIADDGSLEREYTPVPPEVIRQVQSLIQNAIGYNANRGDSVTVTNIPFDRTEQFQSEDSAYHKQQRTQLLLLILLAGLAALLIIFVIIRLITKEMERKRRLAEEERARREQALRESALMQVDAEGTEAQLSVEERARLELINNVTNMAKQHPDDVAQLIRTWLLEE